MWEMVEGNKFKSLPIHLINYNNIEYILTDDNDNLLPFNTLDKIIFKLLFWYTYKVYYFHYDESHSGNVYIWEFKKIRRIKRLYKLNDYICSRNQK